ncbi:hypothetical protein V3F56_13145 [Moorellaceae bacterium AZ2]
MRKPLVRWVVVIAVFIFWCPQVVLAATVKTSPPPGPNMSTMEGIGIEALQYLVNGYSEIYSLSAGTVRLSGETVASQPVDSILLRLYLQRWNGSSWVDIGS